MTPLFHFILPLFFGSLNPEQCQYDSIDLNDHSNLVCLKHHRVTRSMKFNFRNQKSRPFPGGIENSELLERNFLVVGMLHFEPRQFSVVVLFENEPKMYIADMESAGNCSYRISKFEEVKVEPDGPEFLKKTLPELMKEKSIWQNLLTDSDPSKEDEGCERISMLAEHSKHS